MTPVGTEPRESLLRRIARGVGMAVLPAAGLTVGGVLGDAAIRGIRQHVGEALAYRKMDRYLQGLPEERRRYVLGEDYGPDVLRTRFKSLYRLAPDLMADPSVATGLVSESMRVNEQAISPGTAQEFAQLQASIDRGNRMPGIASTIAQSVIPSVTSQIVEDFVKKPTALTAVDRARLDMERAKIDQKDRHFTQKLQDDTEKFETEYELKRTIQRENADLKADLHGEQMDQRRDEVALRADQMVSEQEHRRQLAEEQRAHQELMMKQQQLFQDEQRAKNETHSVLLDEIRRRQQAQEGVLNRAVNVLGLQLRHGDDYPVLAPDLMSQWDVTEDAGRVLRGLPLGARGSVPSPFRPSIIRP